MSPDKILWKTDLWVSLHTADPNEEEVVPVPGGYAFRRKDNPPAMGNQTTHEVHYKGYSRIPLGPVCIIDEAGETAVNAKKLEFPKVKSGGTIAKFLGIGTKKTGPGHLLFVMDLGHKVNLSPSMNVCVRCSDLTITLAEEHR
jgi:hypothetical protein